MKRPILVFALLVFISAFGVCQTVVIKKIELAGEKMIVHYDLEDNNPNNEYQLNLFASKDNYATALTKVKGDIGGEIKPGKRNINLSPNFEGKSSFVATIFFQ